MRLRKEGGMRGLLGRLWSRTAFGGAIGTLTGWILGDWLLGLWLGSLLGFAYILGVEHAGKDECNRVVRDAWTVLIWVLGAAFNGFFLGAISGLLLSGLVDLLGLMPDEGSYGPMWPAIVLMSFGVVGGVTIGLIESHRGLVRSYRDSWQREAEQSPEED